MCYTVNSMDWTKIFQNYKGQWVALADDELTVLGAGKTAKEALTGAQKKGFPEPILTRMPDDLVVFVGGGYEVSVQVE